MKKNLLLLISFFSISIFGVKAQWCVPTTAIPYNADMPGITHVQINTIDRTSTDIENYPSNSYVNTGLSTDLSLGATYSFSVSYTIDATICPDMNIRVWIDYNHDGQLNDVGETVISANNQLPPTYNGTFTIPSTANLGTTRMRVTAKMSPLGGHTLPSPCDAPADPLGYHGEIEDYDINIIDATGISAPNSVLSDLIISSAFGVTKFSFALKQNSVSSLEVVTMEGKLIKSILPSQKLSVDNYSFDLINEELSPGIYLAVFLCDDDRVVRRFVIE